MSGTISFKVPIGNDFANGSSSQSWCSRALVPASIISLVTSISGAPASPISLEAAVVSSPGVCFVKVISTGTNREFEHRDRRKIARRPHEQPCPRMTHSPAARRSARPIARRERGAPRLAPRLERAGSRRPGDGRAGRSPDAPNISSRRRRDGRARAGWRAIDKLEAGIRNVTQGRAGNPTQCDPRHINQTPARWNPSQSRHINSASRASFKRE
jgi:hypothetical protein